VLQASPLARGLFHRAVGMSGAGLGSGVGRAQPLKVGEQEGIKLQAAAKADSIAAMRALPADRILAIQGTTGRYGALIDGWLLPQDLQAIFASGKQNDVPILIGYTRDEGFSPINQAKTLAEYQAHVARYGSQAERLLKLYPATTDAEAHRAAVDVGRDSTLGLQMRGWARAQEATGKAPAYMYFFTRVHPYAPGIKFADHDPATVGAYHTGDVPYWLETLDSLNLFRTTRHWTAYDRELADRMSNAIVAFARSGVPDIGSKVAWPRYRQSDERIVELGDVVRVIPLPNAKKMDFLATSTVAEPAPSATPRISRD
jgi:para-nitrobenzyl esterase